jgi:hypothetical protein
VKDQSQLLATFYKTGFSLLENDPAPGATSTTGQRRGRKEKIKKTLGLVVAPS